MSDEAVRDETVPEALQARLERRVQVLIAKLVSGEISEAEMTEYLELEGRRARLMYPSRRKRSA